MIRSPYASSTPLTLLGIAKVDVKIKDNTHNLEFHVINGKCKPFIGHKTATDLELLHIGMLNTLGVSTDSIISFYQGHVYRVGKRFPIKTTR